MPLLSTFGSLSQQGFSKVTSTAVPQPAGNGWILWDTVDSYIATTNQALIDGYQFKGTTFFFDLYQNARMYTGNATYQNLAESDVDPTIVDQYSDNGNILVNFYNGGLLTTSTDGVNFTARPKPGNFWWSDSYFANNRFVAVNTGIQGVSDSSNLIIYSDNGINWSNAFTGANFKGGSQAITYYGNRYYVIDTTYNSKKLLSSAIGTSWSNVTIANLATGQNEFLVSNPNAIVIARYNTVNLANAFFETYTSTDGSNFALSSNTITANGKVQSLALRVANNRFYATAIYSNSQLNNTFTSTNGFTWTVTNAPLTYPGIFYDSGNYYQIVSGSSGGGLPSYSIIYQSSDGVNFSNIGLANTLVAFDNDFVAAGTDIIYFANTQVSRIDGAGTITSSINVANIPRSNITGTAYNSSSGNVYVIYDENNTIQFNSSLNQAQEWTIGGSELGGARAINYANNHIYVASGSRLVKLTANLEPVWSGAYLFHKSSTYNVNHISYANNTVYVVNDDEIIAYADSNGAQQYSSNAQFTLCDYRNMTVDASNNIIVVGRVANAAFGTANVLHSGLLQKFNSNLNLQWQTAILGNGLPRDAVEFVDAKTDANNNIYVSGYANSTPQKQLILKYNSAGSLLWQRQLTGNQQVANSTSLISNQSKIEVVNDTIYLSSAQFLLSLPGNGSGTGTYAVGNNTVNYQVAAYNANTVPLNNIRSNSNFGVGTTLIITVSNVGLTPISANSIRTDIT